MNKAHSILGLVAAAVSLVAPGCSSGPPRTARQVQPTVVREVPAVLRGTIGAEATLRRIDAQLVSGYGLVVGLRGTGGGDLPERVALTMERELGLRGVGRGSELFKGTEFEGLSPRELLRHPDVGVVIVYAAVPPGAPNGAKFDVYVRALNRSGLTSLEGGTLWTTELRLGPPAAFGGHQTRKVAEANGPIFVNPFAEPAEGMTTGQTIGRVLDGGTVVNSSNIDLVLDNPSHSRAWAIKEAILNRFREGPGDDGPVARGRSASVIEVNVPRAYLDRPVEFINLLGHTRIDQAFPEEQARRYVEALKTQPWLADDIQWCLRALGPAAVAFVRDLYDYPELLPRLAALRAGAGLGDVRAAGPLAELARSGPPAARAEAVRMLGEINAGPTVDVALRELLSVDSLDVRVAAYEALAERAERIQLARWAREMSNRPAAARVAEPSPSLGHLGRIELSGNTVQGVRRKPIGRKFLLDVVPVTGNELIYVTQQGTPRIVLFGSDLSVARPVLLSLWSDRFMVAADSETDDLRVYYRHPRTGQATTGRPGHTLTALIEYLAHDPSPEDPRPGLGMTYSEVVGVLFDLQRRGAIGAAFATEQDRLMAALLKAVEGGQVEERPEFEGDKPELTIYEPVKPGELPAPAPAREPSLVEPLPPKPIGAKDGR